MINQAVEIHRARGNLLRLGGVLRLLAIQLGKNGSQAKARAAVSEAAAAIANSVVPFGSRPHWFWPHG